MIDSKEALFKSVPARKSIEVPIPGGEGSLQFSELSISDRVEYFKLRDREDFTVDLLAAFAVVRASDFLDDEDIPRVKDKFSVEALSMFSTQILQLSGMLKGQDEQNAKE